MSECRLQVNERGSWRNVMDFEAKRSETVKDGACMLQRAGGCLEHREGWRLTFRIVEDNLPRLILDDDGNWRHWGTKR